MHTAALEGLIVNSLRGAEINETVGSLLAATIYSRQQYYMGVILTPPNAVNDNVTYTWTWDKDEVIKTVCLVFMLVWFYQ